MNEPAASIERANKRNLRFAAAVAAMQGMLSGLGNLIASTGVPKKAFAQCAKDSVAFADALLAELEQEEARNILGAVGLPEHHVFRCNSIPRTAEERRAFNEAVIRGYCRATGMPLSEERLKKALDFIKTIPTEKNHDSP